MNARNRLARITTRADVPVATGIRCGARLWLAVALATSLSISACRSEDGARAGLASAEARVVLFFGDSITRGQGLSESEAFPALVEQRLTGEGLDVRAVNAGVSGDTTESALERIEPFVEQKPDVVFVELGANDVFRGLNRLRTHRNLSEIVRRFRDAGARVVVAAIAFPHLQHPALYLSMGRVYEAVARDGGATLVPDFLEGVAGAADLNLPDGVHPNAEGHARLAEAALPAVREALRASD